MPDHTVSGGNAERDFFKLSEPFETIDNPDDMFKVMESNKAEISSILYSSDKLSGKSLSHRKQIRCKEFINVNFIRTIICHVDFHECVFEQCLFISSRIEDCEFHNCKFVDTNTHKIEFKRVYVDPVAFEGCLSPKKHQNAYLPTVDEQLAR